MFMSREEAVDKKAITIVIGSTMNEVKLDSSVAIHHSD